MTVMVSEADREDVPADHFCVTFRSPTSTGAVRPSEVTGHVHRCEQYFEAGRVRGCSPARALLSVRR